MLFPTRSTSFGRRCPPLIYINVLRPVSMSNSPNFYPTTFAPENLNACLDLRLTSAHNTASTPENHQRDVVERPGPVIGLLTNIFIRNYGRCVTTVLSFRD